jgi:uncharacterized protein (TIGR00645 family)
MTSTAKQIEKKLESLMKASHWLMAPIYVGFVCALFVMFWAFMHETWDLLKGFREATQSDAVMGALSLVEFALVANLLMVVIFAACKGFINTNDEGDKGTIGLCDLKYKLVGSATAIASVHLLKIFLNLDNATEAQVKWMVIIYVVFMLGAAAMAFADKMCAAACSMKK